MFSANLVPKHRQNAARRLSPKRNQLRRQLRLESLENRLLMSVSPTLPETLDASVSSALHYDYGRQPLGFESNRGQTSGPVDFVSRGDGYTLFLTPSEAVISLRSGLGSAESNASVLRMEILNANDQALATGLEQQPGTSNYLRGSEPSLWRTDIPVFGRVQYQDVYPGVDLVF